MIGGSQVLEDGVSVVDSVGGEVGVLGEGLLLVLKDQVPHKLGGELENDGAVTFLGGKGKHICYQEVEWEGGRGGKVTSGSSSVKAGLDDLFEHNVRNSIGGCG